MRKRAPLATSGPYGPWWGKCPCDRKAKRGKEVTAVLCAKRRSLREPSGFCLPASHCRPRSMAFLVGSSILTSATTPAGESKAAKDRIRKTVMVLVIGDPKNGCRSLHVVSDDVV